MYTLAKYNHIQFYFLLLEIPLGKPIWIDIHYRLGIDINRCYMKTTLKVLLYIYRRTFKG